MTKGSDRSEYSKIASLLLLLALFLFAVRLFRAGGGPIGDWIAARMPWEGYIEGRVLDQDGIPVAGAKVFRGRQAPAILATQGPPRGKWVKGEPVALTDAEGRFTLVKSGGDRTEFTVSHANHLERGARVENTLGTKDITLKLRRVLVLTGVVSRGGRPLPGWEVSVSCTDPGSIGGTTRVSSITDKEGRFTLSPVEATKRRVSAYPLEEEHPLFLVRREVDLSSAGRTASVDFEFPDVGASIEGMLKVGSEYSGSVLVIVNVDGPYGECHYNQEFPSPGAFRLDALLPGTATVYGKVWAGDYYASESVVVELTDEETTNVVLDLGPLVHSPRARPGGLPESDSP